MRKILFIGAFVIASSFAAQAQSQNTKIQVGQEAPELAYQSPEGKVLSLKKMAKGSYVLLDFWASWCGPCRRANPELVSFYNEYKNYSYTNAPKGFKIYSVSLDRDKDKWVKAIEADKLNWPDHVSDLKSWQSEAAKEYGVSYIPQVFLIGPDGKVIGKYNNTIEVKADLDQFRKVKK